MVEIIESFLKRNEISLSNETIVVAVSTGVDSMALVSSLNEMKEKHNFKIVIAHVNHHKRKQSEIEEEYIKKYAEENNLQCFVKEAYFENTSNFQMVARNLRYEFFYEVMKIVDSKYLFLAHHANDNMETILMRIIRGSNLKGYGGIEEVTKNKNGIILRPFLESSKDDLVNYVQSKKITYYEDSSNKTLDYTRNRIRNEIIPLILKEDEKAYLKFNDFSKLLLRANKSFENEINNFINEKVTFNNNIHISKSDLIQKDELFINEVLFTLLKKYNLGKNNIIEIKKLIFSSKANLKVIYKNMFTFVKEYNDIYIYDYIMEELNINFQIDKCGTYKVNDNISICVSEKTDKPLTNLNVLWYNTNSFPITIRTRHPGDRIYLGNGYRKVKDVLIDEKVGINTRDKVILASSQNEEILIIFGIKKSSKLKEIKDCNIYIEIKQGENKNA